jgi:hypothetical protein
MYTWHKLKCTDAPNAPIFKTIYRNFKKLKKVLKTGAFGASHHTY